MNKEKIFKDCLNKHKTNFSHEKLSFSEALARELVEIIENEEDFFFEMFYKGASDSFIIPEIAYNKLHPFVSKYPHLISKEYANRRKHLNRYIINRYINQYGLKILADCNGHFYYIVEMNLFDKMIFNIKTLCTKPYNLENY